VVADEKWSITLNEYGLTPEKLKTHIDDAQVSIPFIFPSLPFLFCFFLRIGSMTLSSV